MHFASTFCPFVSLFNFSLSIAFLYRTSFHSPAGTETMNMRMTLNSLRLDFERVVYAGEFSNNECMEDDDLPSNLLRLMP